MKTILIVIGLLAIIGAIGYFIFMAFYKRFLKKNKVDIEYFCKYCGVRVSCDHAKTWQARAGDVKVIVCGKQKCMNLYTNNNESTTNEKTSI